jgi:Tol biopolymer transport system component/DNA-binding winged helix-turn-helix (wHTH) protein
MSNQANGLYEFGPYRLDAAKRLLTRSGESIALAPKTFDLLLLLIRGQGRVLTKTELMTALWPDTFVEEASLSYQVATLRKALGSEGDSWIETVPKHGYRFVAAIATVSREQEPADGNSPPMETTALSDRKSTRQARSRQLLPWLVASAAVFLAVVFAMLYLRQVRKSVPYQGAIRFFVSPPERVVLTDRPVPAISPDGALLAFGGVDPDGTTRIWVRPLASFTAEQVQGTEGAYSLFWSPDSRSLGFFAGGKLKTVQLHGGPPRALCDASAVLRPVGTWNRDGVILFNSFDRRGLYRVVVTSGEATPETTLDPARQEAQHLWPRFLPDGRHFIYLVQSTRPENTGIYAGSLDSKERRLVLRTSSITAYAGSDSGTGYLLYMRGATLMAQRFDDRRLELDGEPFPIAEQVWLPPSPAQGFAAFSASGNGVVAYRTLPTATTELVWFDRRGNRLGTVGEPANYSVPALSPDEKKLAITRIDAQIGTRDLYLFDLARATSPARFTFDPAEETNPTWSPDGDQIAFSSNKTGVLDLYQKATSGAGDAEPLLKSSEPKIIESWSPSGRFILYDSGGGLWALPLTGDRKPLSLFARSGDTRATISPNGRWVAYQSSESGREEVYVQSFPSGSQRQVSTAGGEEPYWRRDGKEMFYIAGKTLMAVDVNSNEQAFRNGKPTPLFEVRLEIDNRRSRYQSAGSGQRFLVNVPLESAVSEPITVVTNWESGVKR